MAHVLSSFIDSAGWFFEYDAPAVDKIAAIKGEAESTLEGSSSSDERGSEISWSNSESDRSENSSERFSSSCSSATSSCRSTGSIEELENVDCKSTGSIEEAENDEHMIPAVTEMKRVFATYDENGDGYICKSELEKFMRKLDVDVSEEEISYMIDSVDVNRDGCVDFEEFLELHASLAERAEGCGAEQHDEDAELLEAFQVFDRNQDGFISETELQFVLRNLGINPGVKVQDCQRMISAVDRNNDGQVDFSEFQQLMSSSISCAA